jgi:arylformamidase
MRIHDISVPIHPSMPIWPGDPPVTIEPASRIARGGHSNISRLSLGNHSGTHLDPPIHFIPGGQTIDQLDLRVLYGPARVLDLTHVEQAITIEDLQAAKLDQREIRILFKTRNSLLWTKPGFQTGHVGLARDAAQWLVDRGVKLVGIDYLSVELFNSPEPFAHRALLSAGVIIVEGLDLSTISPKSYTLACLPLLIKDGDGAPARAILIEE